MCIFSSEKLLSVLCEEAYTHTVPTTPKAPIRALVFAVTRQTDFGAELLPRPPPSSLYCLYTGFHM